MLPLPFPSLKSGGSIRCNQSGLFLCKLCSFNSVRQSTRLSDVSRQKMPERQIEGISGFVSVWNSEIKSTTTDPPTPSPGYSACLPEAPWYGSIRRKYPRGVVNIYILQPKRIGFPLMNSLQPCLPKYGITDSSILRFQVLKKVKYVINLSFSMFISDCTLLTLKLNKEKKQKKNLRRYCGKLR